MNDLPREKPALRTTRDYSLFVNTAENRPIELDGRKGLFLSMQQNGFLPAYPIHCIRTEKGKLEIQDGQHRLATAQKLGLSVWYVVTNERVNIAAINATQKAWTPVDYAVSFANQGKKDYAEAIEFSRTYGVPVTTAAALLSGTSGTKGASSCFKQGDFEVRNRAKANTVASIYSQLVALNSELRNARLLDAIYACSFVPGFEADRVIEGAKKSPEKLKRYGTRDANLLMLEELYNFGRHNRQALKIPAENAMKLRNPTLVHHLAQVGAEVSNV